MAEKQKAEEVASPMSATRVNPIAEHFYGTAEQTVNESPFVPTSMLKPYNPDPIYRKTGDYRIYEEMRDDDQVHVCMSLKKDLVLGSGWCIVTEDSEDEGLDQETGKKMAKDIYQRLEEDPDVAFDDQLEELIETGYSYGFAVAEKLFKLRDDQTLTWRQLKTRQPASWLIHTDKHGNVTRYEQRGRKETLNVNPKALVHYVNNRLWDNPYGKSDLRPAYDAWFMKRHIFRYFGIFAEKYASPIPVARYDAKTPKEKVREIFDIIKKFMQKTAMTLPKEVEVEFLESKSDGQVYTRAMNICNMFIGRSLVIPDLLGFSGSESQSGGSQALGREQMTVFIKHIMRRRRAVERIVNKQIIQPLVVWNYGAVEMYPKFQLKPISEDDATNYAKIFIEAARGKLYKPNDEEINHFRSLIKFPEGKVDREEPMQALGLPQPGQPGAVDDEGNPIEQSEDDQKTQDSDQKAAQEADSKNDDAERARGSNADSADDKSDKKEFATVHTASDLSFSKKTDFKALKNQLDGGRQKLIAEAKPVVDEIFDDFINQVRKKKILDGAGGKPDRIDTLKVRNLKGMQGLLKRNFTQFFKDSRVMARSELFKNKFGTPLPSDQFLEFLDKETFDYIGDWEYQITKRARIELVNAIKDGKPLSSVVDVLDTDVKKEAMVSLERYARTKYTEVMNRARLEEFNESKVVQGYEYSAILDDRTSDICAGLHGKTFKLGTEPVPPMHFNCRSVLVPITIYEDFAPSTTVGKTPIEKFIEDNKGDGFSTR